MTEPTKYKYATTAILPALGDKRRRNVLKRKGTTYIGEHEGRKVEYTLTHDVHVDVTEEFKAHQEYPMTGKPCWQEINCFVETAVPVPDPPTLCARIKTWLMYPVRPNNLPEARVLTCRPK